MYAESRSRRQINIGRDAGVERHPEHLADLPCRHRETLRFIDPVLSLGRFAGSTDVDDAADRPVQIDGESLVVSCAGNRCDAGKAGYISFARLQRLLRQERLQWQQRESG